MCQTIVQGSEAEKAQANAEYAVEARIAIERGRERVVQLRRVAYRQLACIGPVLD